MKPRVQKKVSLVLLTAFFLQSCGVVGAGREKNSGFFDEFISLLNEYDGTDVQETGLKADLQKLEQEYKQYDDNLLSRRYQWGDEKYTPLQFAAYQGNLQVVKALCSEKYKDRIMVDDKTEAEDMTALHLAAIGGYHPIVEYLVEEEKLDVNGMDKAGKSAVQYAIDQKKIEVAKYLVEKGKAKLDVSDREEFEVLCVKALQAEKKSSFFKRFEELIDKYDQEQPTKVNPEVEFEALFNDCSQYINERYTWDDDEYTPFLLAAYWGNLHALRALCSEKYGYNVRKDARSAHAKLTALHLAAVGDHLEVVKWLIEKVGMNANVLDHEKLSALHYATHTGNKELVKYLAEKTKSDIYKQSETGWTPLHMAVICEFEVLVEILVEKMDPVDIKDCQLDGKTALQYAEEIKDVNKRHTITEIIRKRIEQDRTLGGQELP